MTPVEVVRPSGPAAPVVFDSPHSGAEYPEDFGHACPLDVLRRCEDAHVDRLIADAPSLGITCVVARFPRAYVDPNRSPEDIDPELLADPWPGPVNPSGKSALGIGLVRRLVAPGIPIYARPLPAAGVQGRIERCWSAYHRALDAELDRIQAGHGFVWYVDWHSMKAVGNAATPDGAMRRPDVVLGDRFGRACTPRLVEAARAAFRARGYGVAVNRPYAGAYLVERHGRPKEGRHALQIELNRALYMDEATLEPNGGFDRLRRDIAAVAADLLDAARP